MSLTQATRPTRDEIRRDVEEGYIGSDADLAAGKRNAYLDGLRAIAERATGDAWPIIEELATLLQRRRTLPGAEVERFLGLRARGLRAVYVIGLEEVGRS